MFSQKYLFSENIGDIARFSILYSLILYNLVDLLKTII
uniref:Uncharacterized protein n=1 Tax=Caloglossa intermedia TaxID=100879 RepID=A0A1Z1M5Q3_9FLOR|nr:hypothetical protein [Caloglossa intermedia]ARW61408.1 hypothetical protein [Caloglossa intermedia]